MSCIGNVKLLELPKTAFFASRETPPGAEGRCRAWAAAERDAGRCVMSAFHSPLEAAVLDELLKEGVSPIVMVLGRKPYKTVPESWRAAVGAGRMVLFSLTEDRRASLAASRRANRWMLEHAEGAVFGSVSPGGLTEEACREAQEKKLPCRQLED